MCNKIIRFVTTLILCLISSFLLAEQIETQIFADTITVERGEILFAEGNVTIQYGDNTLKAESLIFNQKNNELQINEIKKFYSKI